MNINYMCIFFRYLFCVNYSRVQKGFFSCLSTIVTVTVADRTTHRYLKSVLVAYRNDFFLSSSRGITNDNPALTLNTPYTDHTI
jgi:hypothetical protein